MTPYASTHGRRYRMRRFPTASGLPRFALTSGSLGLPSRKPTRSARMLSDCRTMRLVAVADRAAALPPLVPAQRPQPVLRRWMEVA